MPGTSKQIPTPCVGILFVHGAGEHGKGKTLLEFGEPIAHWLEEWLTSGAGEGTFSQVDVTAAELIPRDGDPQGPANVTLRFTGADGRKHRWLLAESWWDASFPTPGFSQVVRWALTIVPWLAITQFIAPAVAAVRSPRKKKPGWRGVMSLIIGLVIGVIWLAGALVTGMVLTGFVEVLAVSLLVLAVVPIDKLRDLVGSVMRGVSGSLGDLYIVLCSPFQRATLAAAVGRDLAWMRAKGPDRLVVIAHSQGAYVAHLALLAEADPTNVNLITLGSGAIRIREATDAHRSGFILASAIATCGALMLASGLTTILPVYFGRPGTHDPLWAVTGLIGIVLTMLGLSRAFALVVVVGEAKRVPRIPGIAGWTDYLATYDPVVNGSPADRLPEGVRSVNVHNRGSAIADHSNYWSNPDEFVANVVHEIGRLDAGLALGRVPSIDARGTHAARTTITEPHDSERTMSALIKAAGVRRAWRVRILVSTRIALATAALMAVIASLGVALEIGVSTVADVKTVTDHLPNWARPDWAAFVPTGTVAQKVIGIVVLLAPSFLAYRVTVALWDRWGDRDYRSLVRRAHPDDGGAEVIAFAAWSLACVSILVIVAAAGGLGPAARFAEYLVTDRPPAIPVVVATLAGVVLAVADYGFGALTTARLPSVVRDALGRPEFLISTTMALSIAVPTGIVLSTTTTNLPEMVAKGCAAGLGVEAVCLIVGLGLAPGLARWIGSIPTPREDPVPVGDQQALAQMSAGDPVVLGLCAVAAVLVLVTGWFAVTWAKELADRASMLGATSAELHYLQVGLPARTIGLIFAVTSLIWASVAAGTRDPDKKSRARILFGLFLVVAALGVPEFWR
jgi:hypothetical protein